LASKILIISAELSVFEIPCDLPESDGTIEWSKNHMVLLTLRGGEWEGIGYTYGHPSIAQLIKTTFSTFLKDADVFDITYILKKCVDAVRNDGLPGIAAHAISAIDTALWDLKAKVLGIPLCKLWGSAREKMPVYGSGGFTSYTEKELKKQFEGWQAKGITAFKMKVGREPNKDIARVKQARKAIGKEADLYVDANGAYTAQQALALAEYFKEEGVVWFEEPVSSDALEQLCFIRERIPPGINIAAGEYGYTIGYFNRMLAQRAVDVLQADATRCCGFTGFLQAAHLAHAYQIPFSSHTSPSLHLHPCLTLPHACKMEYFHDHVRIENLLFEGTPKLQDGYLFPNLEKAGHGMELKKQEAKPYLIDEAKIF
jgi:L-alanine-DL-glutamate epimerase-like enolase superfamily enzyme